MCEIQLIHKFDDEKLDLQDIGEFKKLMYNGGYNNSDAWGVYVPEENNLYKEGGKLEWNSLKYLDEYLKISTIFGHNRYKTKGDNKINHNNHPFETENFILVHNGVLSNDEELKKNNELEYVIDTDSYIVIALLEKIYSVTKDVYKTLSQVGSCLSGSFSILTYFKPEKKLFYFKNNGTKFYFGLIKKGTNELLYGSTSIDSLKELYLESHRGIFKCKKYKIEINEPLENTIFEINNKEINVVGRFTPTNYLDGKLLKYNVTTQEWDKLPSNTTEKEVLNKDFYTYNDYCGYYGINNSSNNSKLQTELVTKLSEEEQEARLMSLQYYCDSITNYIMEHFNLETINQHISIYSNKLWLIIDGGLNTQMEGQLEEEFHDSGHIKFKTRKNSGKSEIIFNSYDFPLITY